MQSIQHSEAPRGARSKAAATPAPGPATPRVVLWGASLAIGGLVLGAVYLAVVRADALMLDLSAFSRFAICF